MTNSLSKWLSYLHDALFPKRCAGCNQKGSYLCENCEPFIRRREYHDGTLAVTSYADPAVKKLVWLLKFRGVKEIASLFAGWIYESLLEEIAEIAAFREQGGKILLVPVPLSAKRQRRRGFNQAEEIARALAALEPKLFRLEEGNLRKIRETPTQVSCGSRIARLANLHGAFQVTNRRLLRGRTVILIDDVTTTGATLSEAERVLGTRPRRVMKVAVAG